MKIGIAFDLAPASAGKPHEGADDHFEEFDKPETIEAVAAVLRGEGHEVVLLGDGRPFLEAVLHDSPDLVWNMAEGTGVGRCREARVPAVLEMLGVPCTGSDPLTLAASLDKDVARRIVESAGVVVAAGVTVSPATGRDPLALAELAERAAPPWIIKPAFEGSSKGIRNRSVADTEQEAVELLGELFAEYAQPMLVEEYVAGDEVTVGIVGEGAGAEVVGTMRVGPRKSDERFVYSLEMKREWRDKIVYDVPAPLSDSASERLERSALAAYRALGCRDVARIDFRIRDGVPYFLEANPLPGLAPDWSDLVILARGVGLSHADLIRRILASTLKRLGLCGVQSPEGARH